MAERALGELWKADLTLRLDETYISSPQMFRPDSTGFPEVVDLLVQTSVLSLLLNLTLSVRYFMSLLRMVPRNLQSRD